VSPLSAARLATWKGPILAYLERLALRILNDSLERTLMACGLHTLLHMCGEPRARSLSRRQTMLVRFGTLLGMGLMLSTAACITDGGDDGDSISNGWHAEGKGGQGSGAAGQGSSDGSGGRVTGSGSSAGSSGVAGSDAGSNVAGTGGAASAAGTGGGSGVAGAGSNPSTELCGDHKCTNGETCAGCPQDCGQCPFCGDGACNNGENCSGCPQDCGSCCGNGKCDNGETCSSCKQDCGSCCGNGACDDNETWDSCSKDCEVAGACKPKCELYGCAFTSYAWFKCDGGQNGTQITGLVLDEDCRDCKAVCIKTAQKEGWYSDCNGNKKFLYSDNCTSEK
jgi:hypothetical protein